MQPFTMTCPDCRGAGYFNIEADEFDYAEVCIACEGQGNIRIEPTPGPWRVWEVQSASEPDRPAGLTWLAPEGHMGIYSWDSDAPRIEIRSTTLFVERLMGDGLGGVIATIPMAHGEAGRAQALINAHALLRGAPNA